MAKVEDVEHAVARSCFGPTAAAQVVCGGVRRWPALLFFCSPPAADACASPIEGAWYCVVVAANWGADTAPAGTALCVAGEAIDCRRGNCSLDGVSGRWQYGGSRENEWRTMVW
jgi:hypothetical protein